MVSYNIFFQNFLGTYHTWKFTFSTILFLLSLGYCQKKKLPCGDFKYINNVEEVANDIIENYKPTDGTGYIFKVDLVSWTTSMQSMKYFYNLQLINITIHEEAFCKLNKPQVKEINNLISCGKLTHAFSYVKNHPISLFITVIPRWTSNA